ncbi:MAG: ATP-binding cassette domain-containing protein, partial [Verrucomicrobiota bacterium]
MSQPIIEVDKLCKLYRLGSIGAGSLKESISYWLNPNKADAAWAEQAKKKIAPGRAGPRPNTVWALKEASFTVNEGETLGIVGRNGAGKSTLLKLLSRITEPTGGRAIIRGRVSSLLEVGTG